MAKRNIIKIGDPKLTSKSKKVEKFDNRLHELLDDMAETMYHANGVGLAAPQVGILKRVIVVDVGDGLYEMINPEIIASEGEEAGAEGCLSIPGKLGLVVRPEKVTVTAQDRNGDFIELTAEGFAARAFCHEIDHLNGILYVDIMERELQPEELESEENE